MAFGALIPAAGLSSRMGRFKPLLPLGSSTFLDQLLHTMRAAGVGPVVIVTGWHAEEIEAHLAGQPEVFLVHNPEYARTQMFDSIRQGLPLLQSRCSPFPCRTHCAACWSIRPPLPGRFTGAAGAIPPRWRRI